jgi:hypothetical protein
MLACLALAFMASSVSACGHEVVVRGTTESHPAAVGQEIAGVAFYLEPAPGDSLQLISAEPLGNLEGADVRLLLSRPVEDPPASYTIGEQVEALQGAVVEVSAAASAGPWNDVGIVAQVTARMPGTYDLTGVRLRYRLNGREQQRDAELFFRVCADDPAPTIDACPIPELSDR